MNLITAAFHRALGSVQTGRPLDAERRHEDSPPPERSAERGVEGPPHSARPLHSPLRTAITRLPLWLTLLLGTAAFAILGFFWLEIPDSHTWQLAFSLLVATAIAAGFLALYATAIRRIRAAAPNTPLWFGIVLLAIWLLVIWLLVHLIAHIEPGISDRAGYLNSKLSPHLRVTFSYLRLIAWQHHLELILIWVILPALLLPFVIETVAYGPQRDAWRNPAHVLRRWQHWLAMLVITPLGLWLTGRLTSWQPTHTVHGELVSVTLRLGIVYVLDIVLFLLALGFDSELLARTDASRNPAP